MAINKAIQLLLRSTTQRVMTVTFVGMMVALLVDLLIATTLGATVEADALIVALSLPRLLETVGREGTRFSLVTLFTDVEKRMEKAEFEYFVSGLLNLFLSVGLGLVLMGWLLARPIVSLIGPGLTLAAQEQAAHLFRSSVILVVFALGSTVLEALLNSLEHFLAVSLRNGSISLIVVVAIFLAWRSPFLSMVIAVAYVVGYGLFFMWLLWYMLLRVKLHYRWFAWPGWENISYFWRAVVYPTMGLGIRQGSRVAERAFASLVAPGGVAVFYFAFRLISAIQTIIGVSIATIGLSKITEHALVGADIKFVRSLRRQVGRGLLLSLPITLLIFLFHDQIVSLLYAWGKVTAESAENISQVLRYMGLGLVFWTTVSILTPALYALKKYSWVFYAVIANTMIYLPVSWLFSQIWGLLGLAIAMVILTALHMMSVIVLIYLALKSTPAFNLA